MRNIFNKNNKHVHEQVHLTPKVLITPEQRSQNPEFEALNTINQCKERENDNEKKGKMRGICKVTVVLTNTLIRRLSTHSTSKIFSEGYVTQLPSAVP